MLQLARRFWRRMVDRPGPGTAIEDRRSRARCRSTAATAVRARDGAVCWPARVLDVSHSGIALVVPGVIEPGEVVGIEVPTGPGTAPSVVLASVANVRPGGEGEWVLGCCFSEELSDADLGVLRAREGETPPPDLRASERLPCNVRAAFELLGEEPPACSPARVLNVSLGGIGLVADRPITAGSLLNLQLQRADGQAGCSLLACVVHVSNRTGNEWVLGCSFIRELSDADLAALLR